MAIAHPKVGEYVQVVGRPQLKGKIDTVDNESYVLVEFDGVADMVGVATERLEYQ